MCYNGHMIREITDRAVWTTFLNEAGSPSFLQAWEWGELNRKHSGYDVIRLGSYDVSGNLQATAQILKIRAKRGSFFFIPHGPTFRKTLEDSSSTRQDDTAETGSWNIILRELLDYLIPLARAEGYAFIRLSPVQEYSREVLQRYKETGFRVSPIYMHAERVWTLPLDKSEDELLAGMRKTTRYLIRRAVKDGVTIERRTDNRAIEDFWKLYEETAAREQFTPFSKEFVDNEFKEFFASGKADYFFGKVGDEYLAGALIVYTDSTAFYHQGASRHTKYPAPYALQWEAIKHAKQRGCALYNFWGILQEGRTPKAWSGLTLFKKGFGGRQIDYIPTIDYVISPLQYAVSWLFETFLRWRRGI